MSLLNTRKLSSNALLTLKKSCNCCKQRSNKRWLISAPDANNQIMTAWDVRQHADVPEPMLAVKGLTGRLLSKLDSYREACGRSFAPRLEPVGSRAKARSGIPGSHPL